MNTLAVAVGANRSDASILATLSKAGYPCLQFTTTSALLRGLRREQFDAVVIDTDCTDIAWRSLLERRRQGHHASTPVMLAGPACPGAAEALAAGADDFVAKPLVPEELLARLQTATRRHQRAAAATSVAAAGFVVDSRSSSLVSPSGGISLTARELALARLMFEEVGRVVPRHRLARDIWGCDEDVAAHSIEQHVYQLRRKLKRCAGDALVLRGIYGSGYRLDAIAREGQA